MFRANIYGLLDGEMVMLQLRRRNPNPNSSTSACLFASMWCPLVSVITTL